MRMLVLVPAAAVLVFGTPALATATASMSDQRAVATEGQTVGMRLAQGQGNPTPPSDAGNLTNNSQGCLRRSNNVVSPSSPNNGFGNCPNDGTPGGSVGTPGKDDTKR